MSLADKMRAKVGNIAPGGNSRIARALMAAGPGKTPEFNRIAALPRRVLDLKNVPDVSPLFVLERQLPCNVRYCQILAEKCRLRPIQSAMLIEATEASGLFAPVGVGWGKTLTALLLPLAMTSARAVLLVPPQLKTQLLEADVPHLQSHFHLPPVRTVNSINGISEALSAGPGAGDLYVLAYSQLSDSSLADVLEHLAPDLVIADEAHHLRHKDAARTRRFLRYFKDHPGTRFVAMSGTLTKRSIRDYAHLCELALRKGSPVPHDFRDLEAWAAVLDSEAARRGGLVAGEGALALFCQGNEKVRDGFRRRVNETPGVIATTESSAAASLTIRLVGNKKLVPEYYPDSKVLAALADFDRTQHLGGLDIDSAAHAAMIRQRLLRGFYYELEWPGGTPDLDWLRARNGWNRAVRSYLQSHNKPGWDSPGLLETQAAQGRAIDRGAWAAWQAVAQRPEPKQKVVWVSHYLVDALGRTFGSRRGSETHPTLIWTQDPPIGEALQARHGIPYYGEGSDSDLLNAHPEDCPNICLSIQAHGFGKNLQAWAHNFVIWPPSAGDVWEQLIGRTHRPAQLADEVTFSVLITSDEALAAWDKALADAAYREETTGSRERLRYATILRGPALGASR